MGIWRLPFGSSAGVVAAARSPIQRCPGSSCRVLDAEPRDCNEDRRALRSIAGARTAGPDLGPHATDDGGAGLVLSDSKSKISPMRLVNAASFALKLSKKVAM